MFSNELANLLPVVHALSREEKLYLIQQLSADLASETDRSKDKQSFEDAIVQAGRDFPAWNPLEAYEAAEILAKMLREAEDLE